MTTDCRRCQGKGQFRGEVCFRCNGQGKFTKPVFVKPPRRKRRQRKQTPAWLSVLVIAAAGAEVAGIAGMRLLAGGFIIVMIVTVVLCAPRPARKRQRIPDVTREAVFVRDGWKCRNCTSRWRLTIDHIIPISQGGSDRMNNLQTLCGPCNSSKGTKRVFRLPRIRKVAA
jgi:HNH endonuclease